MKRQFYMLESSEQTVNILCFQVLDLLYSNMRLVPFPLQQVPFLRCYVFLDDGNLMCPEIFDNNISELGRQSASSSHCWILLGPGICQLPPPPPGFLSHQLKTM